MASGRAKQGEQPPSTAGHQARDPAELEKGVAGGGVEGVDLRGEGQVVDWYLRARLGDAEAQFMCGIMHFEGRGLGPVNLEAATGWFELAHAQGFTGAADMLGTTGFMGAWF
jgi:TPR repeat protein